MKNNKQKKHLIYTLLFLVVFSCNKKEVWDCIQTSGNTVFKELSVTAFERILVNRDIELVVKKGEVYMVEIQTGINLLGDIDVIVSDLELQLTNSNNCNFVRDYGVTKMIVTTPILKEIRSSTQYLVSSQGVLEFDNLKLISENYNSDFISSGDFNITINSQTFSVLANNLSSFKISGYTDTLSVDFYGGVCQFDGIDLLSQNVNVFQRSSHDIIVNPVQSIEGEIRSVGDVISLQTPPFVNVQQFYTGQLLFLD